MRVIAGTHGGRRLRAPDSIDTRPVTDRVKESVFSSLGGAIVGAAVADLYAGAGSFGIEALSRGAASVVFVESGRKALGALDANLTALGMDATIVRSPVEGYVASCHHTFDVVFCDPPWSLPASELTMVLESLLPTLGAGSVVVITRRSGDEVPTPAGYAIDDERRLGDTRIIRYQPEAQP
jgi:16S rRNA (guanine966-N2)-methyltransferase